VLTPTDDELTAHTALRSLASLTDERRQIVLGHDSPRCLLEGLPHLPICRASIRLPSKSSGTVKICSEA
jgi:hypothetical protein